MALIALDAGHGDKGGDPGAVAGDGTREADINLQLANGIAWFLKQMGHNILMLRTGRVADFPMVDDEVGDLPHRVMTANMAQAAVYISVHCNAAKAEAAEGYEVWYRTSSGQGKHLALFILNEIHLAFRGKAAGVAPPSRQFWSPIERGAMPGGWHVLVRTRMPAVLLEAAFITNAEDLARLKSKEYRAVFTKAVAEGIHKFLKEGGKV